MPLNGLRLKLVRQLTQNRMSSPPVFTESWLPGPKDTQFYTRTYAPNNRPKAAVVFIHGFAEHIGRYTHFHPLLSQHDIAVFAVDQRGFGKTAQDTDGNKSKDSAYGKTSWDDQMIDIAWAVEHAKTAFSGIPTFLMGHSMGGAEVLGFASSQPSASSLAGIISTSPLILQTKPASKLLRAIGGAASNLFPYQLVPAPVVPGDLSHDPAVNDAYLEDPLVRPEGSLRGIKDMLSNGERLLKTGYKNWPKSLPLLLVHGSEDMVTSAKASQTFYDQLTATDKKLKLFEGGYHEVHNEPNGVKEELASDIIAFIEEHLQDSAAASEPERSKM
ncbi:hypothetical protein H0H92_007707 [Tricholoma furcatifolium]|nr:hypothetical protein H0H92_007707 [Tricholoma furcatifolium]